VEGAVKVSKTQFFLAVLGALLFVSALNYAVGTATQDTVPRRLMARVPRAADASVLALGNSLIGVGFVESEFDRGMGLSGSRGSLNIALGGSTPVEQLLLLRYALHSGIRPGTVIYGFYDFQLTHPVEFIKEDIAGNHAMLYYVEPEYARSFYRLSLRGRIQFELMRHFPLFTDRSAVWQQVELFRRRLSQQGMPEEKTSVLGRANDFALLEYPSTPAFVRECGRASHRDLIPAIREIVLQSEAAGSKVVFVEMPMPPAHVASFYDTPAWPKYRDHVHSLLAGMGVTFIDASHWMPDESMFADPLHLSWEGSKQFSVRLGETLKGELQFNSQDSAQQPAQKQ
jgi:hypothetical protein